MDKFEINKRLKELSDKITIKDKDMSEAEKKEILSELYNILDSNPQNTDALFCQEMIYKISRNYKKAILINEENLKINPDNEEAKESIADLTDNMNKNNSPDLLEKVSVWHIVVFKAVVVAIIVYVCFMPIIQINYDKKILDKANKTEQSSIDGFENLHINPMSDYDYLSKKEIYEIRKKYVNKSVFANPDYKPLEEIFGQIVDNKPWWGDIRCEKMNNQNDYHEHIEGNSKVSIQVNNPNVLVGVTIPYMPWDEAYYGEFCTSEYSKFMPYSLKYNKNENLLVATYKILPEFLRFRVWINKESKFFPLQLSGLNARDFGYNYVWAVDTKNIKMFNSGENVVDEVQTFKDFIHLGGSCKYQDGCNNVSPAQNGLMFNVKSLPAEISLKLWKKQPSNKYSKADMYYKIIFEQLYH